MNAYSTSLITKQGYRTLLWQYQWNGSIKAGSSADNCCLDVEPRTESWPDLGVQWGTCMSLTWLLLCNSTRNANYDAHTPITYQGAGSVVFSLCSLGMKAFYL
jgi:hypothetical protein